RTVVFHLTESWPNFPYMLANTPGMIVSPAAARKWGEDFGTHPVGAGPFTLARFAPGEEIMLTVNENYWGEQPHLDRLRFVPISGPQAKLDTLNVGGLDAAFLRDPEFIADALRQGYSGYMTIQHAGGVLF